MKKIKKEKQMDLIKLDKQRRRKWRRELAKRRKKRSISRSSDSSPQGPRSHRYRVQKAPTKFMFVENTNEILKYLLEIDALIDCGKRVKIDIAKIESLSPDAIAILCAWINKSKKGHIKGNAPLKPFLSNQFIRSGFYNYVHTFKRPKTDSDSRLNHKQSFKRVDPQIAKQCTDFAIEHVDTQFQGEIKKALYEILIELMANTHNHAKPEALGTCDWWLHYYYDSTSKKICFTFLDFGVGVFKSQKFKKLFGLFEESIEKKAKALLDGEIVSRTGLSCRGKGFSCIVNNAQKDIFAKFILVTNEAKIDIKMRNVSKLSKEFPGTFFYWEI